MKKKISLTEQQMIVIMVALKELETSIENRLPYMTYITDLRKDLDVLLNDLVLLEDSKELQSDFCFIISSPK